MSRILIRWLVTTLAILAVPHLISGVRVEDFGTALAAAAVLGVLNTLVRPILIILTLPLTFVTLGFFLLIINAGLFELAGALVTGMKVESFWAAFLAAIVVTIVSWVMDFVTGDKRVRRINVVRIDENARPTRDAIDLNPDKKDHWE
jgi:putative membrane protein